MLTSVWGIFTGVSEVCEDCVINVDEYILMIFSYNFNIPLLIYEIHFFPKKTNNLFVQSLKQ